MTKEETKFLKIKTDIVEIKLKEKYTDIVILCVENDPGNIRIGFIKWGIDSKVILVLGGKNQDSYWINNVNFNTNVKNNGIILSSNINKEIDDLCLILDNLIQDFLNIKN